MDLGLKDKLVLVTGSTDGIGLEIARGFLGQGSRVVINGRKQDRVDAIVASLVKDEKADGRVFGVAADLADAKDCENLVEQVNKLGELDVLVSNAGIFGTQDFFETTDELWLQYHNVNIMPTVRLCRAFLKPMLKRNSGRVLVMASETGMRPIKEMIHYSASKSSVISISRGLAELTRGTNVTVNSILAGPTMTPGVVEYIKGLAKTKNMTPEEAQKQYFQVQEPTSIIQRFCTTKEIADVTLFLASNLSSAINGAAQRVEGGVIRHL